jgi:hypothetical protein
MMLVGFVTFRDVIEDTDLFQNTTYVIRNAARAQIITGTALLWYWFRYVTG